MSWIDDDAPVLRIPVGPNDHVLGSSAAPVTLLEYGDYECPHCARAHRVMNRVLGVMGRRLRYAFRNFPLTQVHPHAMIAAQAAEAAGAQGRFWEMHSALFGDQEALELDDLAAYAADLQLDTDRFVTDLKTARYAERVREDFRGGVRSGVNGTPAFFINGLRYDGPWDYESLLEVLQAAAGSAGRRAA